MALVVTNPIQVRLQGYETRRAELERHLIYLDKRVDFEISSFKRNRWYAEKYGHEAYFEKLEELKAQRKKTLLFEDEHGLWTYSGLAKMLADAFGDTIQVEYQLPDAELVPWAHAPDRIPRYYQEEAKRLLISAGHAGVEIGTGLGKSFIILLLLKQLGLPAVVMAPSINIAQQLYDELTHHFGKKYVGFFGHGKKQFDKLFVVAVAASLAKVKPGTPAWDRFQRTKVFVADESHLCPATTLSKVCFELLKNAPYRFFFSGTQIRSDGLDLVLDAITGPIVYRMTVQEGVDQGFLAKPVFRMVRLDSTVTEHHQDANVLTRAHVFYNSPVAALAADIANKAVSLMGRPTVILVEELQQFSYLLPYLRYEARFAHGGVTKENKKHLPAEYHESDPKQLVADFNAGKFPILVGTSCITTGTDIKHARCILFLRGGKSEVEVKQAVGRGTRLVPGKEDCLFVDFCIDNVPTLQRHAMARKAIYADIYPSYSEMRV